MEKLEHQTEAVLLNEIRDLLAAQNRKDGERTVLLRIILGLAIAMMLAVTLFLCAFVPKLQKSLDAFDEIAGSIETTISDIDVKQIQSLIEETEQFASNSTAMIEQAETVLQGVAAVDFEALNQALNDLGAAVDNFATLDMGTLNRAIENLNETIEPLANFLKKFK